MIIVANAKRLILVQKYKPVIMRTSIKIHLSSSSHHGIFLPSSEKVNASTTASPRTKSVKTEGKRDDKFMEKGCRMHHLEKRE